MTVGVADTHAALWYLYDDPRLSRPAGKFIDEAVRLGRKIGVSAISMAELIYLTEKNRVPVRAYTDLRAVLDDPAHVFIEIAFTGEVAASMRQIPRADIPDMPDRIIAATAVSLQVPIISRDGYIRASALQTIW